MSGISGVPFDDGCVAGVKGLTPSDFHTPVGGENGEQSVDGATPFAEASLNVAMTGLTAPESGFGCLISPIDGVESFMACPSAPEDIRFLATSAELCVVVFDLCSGPGLGPGLAFMTRREPNFMPPMCL